MGKIILLLLVSMILIYWFQSSLINDKKNKIYKLYNMTKLPIIVVCLMLIILSLSSSNILLNESSKIIEQKVFMGIPSF